MKGVSVGSGGAKPAKIPAVRTGTALRSTTGEQAGAAMIAAAAAAGQWELDLLRQGLPMPQVHTRAASHPCFVTPASPSVTR